MGKDINSPYLLATSLQNDLGGTLFRLDIDHLDQSQKRDVANIKRLAADARLDTRDYELSETRTEQLDNARQAQGRLEELRKSILHASEYGIFGSVEVAHTSARIDQIISLLI